MDSSHGIFTYIQLTSAQNMEVSRYTKYFFYWKTIPTYAYTNTIDSDFHICTFFSYTHFLQGDYNMEYQVLVPYLCTFFKVILVGNLEFMGLKLKSQSQFMICSLYSISNTLYPNLIRFTRMSVTYIRYNMYCADIVFVILSMLMAWHFSESLFLPDQTTI